MERKIGDDAEEGVRDHYHERVSVQALPGPSLEVSFGK